MKHKSQVRQNPEQNKRSSNHAGRNLGPFDPFPRGLCRWLFNAWRNAFFCFHPADMSQPARGRRAFGGVCIDTALLCWRRKTWSHLTLLIASWLIRFTRNCQILKPQIIISHNKRIYCAINFVPSRFSKSEITNCCKTFIAYFNLFLPPVRKCLKELFWCSLLSLFLCIKNNICVYLFSLLWLWNLCHSGTVRGKSSVLLSAPKGQGQEKSIKILVFRVWMGRTSCLLHICGSRKEEDEHEFNFPASWVKYMAWKQSTRLAFSCVYVWIWKKDPWVGSNTTVRDQLIFDLHKRCSGGESAPTRRVQAPGSLHFRRGCKVSASKRESLIPAGAT